MALGIQTGWFFWRRLGSEFGVAAPDYLEWATQDVTTNP